MKPPPWLNDPCALVILDWSWWLNRAMHGTHGVEGMLPLVVGWLCQLLAYEPAHLAIALDSPGETWRHAKRHPTEEGWRYKADRPPKPPAFAHLSSTATRIAELHGIPCLWADRFEADDVIATATARARDAGYRVWIATADKDLHHLVEDDPRAGLIVGTWNPFEGDLWTWRGPEAVREEYGVDPEQIADWLAIAGDKSDGVPGIGNDIGPTKAAAILAEYRTLAAALEAPVWSSTKGAEIEAEIKALESAIGKAKRETKKSGGALPPLVAEQVAQRVALMDARKLAGWHLTLKAHAPLALFSRELTALDCDAPFDMPWEDLPLGGYQVEELRALYTKLGYQRKAAEAPHREKRAPWRTPWQAEDGAPAPRRIDGDEVGQDVGRRGAAVGQGRREVSAAVDVEPRVADEAAPAERPGASSRPETEELGGAVHEGRAPALGAPEQVGLVRELPALPAVAPGAVPDSPGRPSVLTPASPWCCSFSRCGTDPVHRRIVEATAAIRDMPDAVRVCGLIQKSGMVELPRVEHARIAMDRGRSLTEGRAA